MQPLIFRYESASAKLANLEPVHALSNVYSRKRGLGHANGLMRLITEYADEHGITIVLMVQRYGYSDKKALDNIQLMDFYGKFGFIKNPDSKPPYIMARLPRIKNTPHSET